MNAYLLHQAGTLARVFPPAHAAILLIVVLLYVAAFRAALDLARRPVIA